MDTREDFGITSDKSYHIFFLSFPHHFQLEGVFDLYTQPSSSTCLRGKVVWHHCHDSGSVLAWDEDEMMTCSKAVFVTKDRQLTNET